MHEIFMDWQQFSEEGTYIRVTISLTPYPLFQRFLQSNLFLLNLSTKC